MLVLLGWAGPQRLARVRVERDDEAAARRHEGDVVLGPGGGGDVRGDDRRAFDRLGQIDFFLKSCVSWETFCGVIVVSEVLLPECVESPPN